MQNLMNDLAKLFQKDYRIFSDGKLLKNKLTELTLKLDSAIIELLLSDKRVKDNFFVEQKVKNDKILVFDKDKFISFVNNKEFLPDSFTSFKNKIGLISNGDYLKEKSDVVLAWAYKDCVLEGGQDREDQKRDEIFYNETLAPDEIDLLFDPKVFTNFKKFDVKGEHKVTKFNADDNLIIKGNNLLVLHCLKKKYRGKVKLICIDPPYSGNAEGFDYNNRFKTSTWLTFMKNRMEVAKELLTEDGAIFVQISDLMVSHVRLLMDEIFGPDNFINKITVKTKSPSGFKVVNLGVFENAEYILSYAKNKKLWVYNPQFVKSTYDKNYSFVIDNIKSSANKWKISSIIDCVTNQEGFQSSKQAEKTLTKQIFAKKIAEFALNNANRVFRFTAIGDDAGKETLKIKEKSNTTKGKVFVVKRDEHLDRYVLNGQEIAFYNKKIREIDGEIVPTTMLTNIWTDISWEGIASEGGVTLKKGKKPERLLRRIINMATTKNDIVMDFNLGSGTTCAVAHKMRRRYIGIEQLDYGDNDAIIRLQNVINNDNTGISKLEKWKSGGLFIYAELMQWNEKYMQSIKDSNTSSNLLNIYKNMKKEAFFRYDIDLSAFNETEFVNLSLKEQKQVLCECLDKNHLYVNLSEIDDTTYKVSKNDKKLNKIFYM